MLEVQQALGRPAEDIAHAKKDRAIVLGELGGRFGDAKVELETCLRIFQNDPAGRARTLGSLAALFYKQGDVAHAITQERRAFALFEALPGPRDRANSHNNLARFLQRSGMPSALAEFPLHQLAALIYQLVSGLGQDLQTSLRNYAFDFRRGARTELDMPRMAELLADPAFRPLDDWLRQQQADLGEVQAAVDQFLDQARQLALNRSNSRRLQRLHPHNGRSPTCSRSSKQPSARGIAPVPQRSNRRSCNTWLPRRRTAMAWNAASAP